jgi:hypothetical protein
MKQSALRRYSALYRASAYYGAGDILRRHAGLPADFVLPLGLGHGVDFGQSLLPTDIHGPEPIFWAYHIAQYEQARSIKPSVLIPHPYLLVDAPDGPRSDRALVIGPPPSRENDLRLLESLRRYGVSDGVILVKRRTGWEQSVAFWESQGFGTRVFGNPFETGYGEMAKFFSTFKFAIGCTVSSAVLFAAASGCNVDLLRDYSLRAYELSGIEKINLQHSPVAMTYVRNLVGPDQAEKKRSSREFLGAGLDFSRDGIRHAIEESIDRLDRPVHFSYPVDPPMRWLLQEAARRTGRVGLIVTPWKDRLSSKNETVGILEMNDVDMWLHGRSANNFRFEKIPLVRGRTVPGDGIDSY